MVQPYSQSISLNVISQINSHLIFNLYKITNEI